MWKKVHCAVQGRSHVKSNIPCQDKTFCYQEGDVLVAALADGAGSAKLSHYGAACITEYIAKDIAKYFDLYYNCDDGVSVKKQFVSKIINKLNELSEELNCNKKDCASTLLVVAVSDSKFILMHIGDGVIGYIKNKQLKIASLPENGEFSNVTVFTTSSDVLSTMKLLKGNLNDIDAFILMSDGSEAGLYSKRNKSLTPALLRVTDFVRYFPETTVQSMLTKSLENVVKQVTTDDCSIAIIANDYEKDIRSLSIQEQCNLLEISDRRYNSRKKSSRISIILDMLKKPTSLVEIAKRFHLKKKYARKYTDILLNKGIVDKNKDRYNFLE